MFIEKIGYDDEICLAKKFARHVYKNCKIDDFFIVKNYGSFINVCFSVNGSPCSCNLKDFEITLSFGTKKQIEECENIYRNHMYEIFHDRYIEGIKNYYTQSESQKSAETQR